MNFRKKSVIIVNGKMNYKQIVVPLEFIGIKTKHKYGNKEKKYRCYKKIYRKLFKKPLKICCFPFIFISELGNLYFLNPKQTFEISKIALK